MDDKGEMMTDEELLKLAEMSMLAINDNDVTTHDTAMRLIQTSQAASLLVLARNSGRRKEVFTEEINITRPWANGDTADVPSFDEPPASAPG